MSLKLQLVVIAGPAAGRTFPLADGQTLIVGRGQASDTQIDDPHMSRVHCLVQVKDGKVVLLDSDSAAGTWMDGERVSKQELKLGNVFEVGETQFRLELAGFPEASVVEDEPPADLCAKGGEDSTSPLHTLAGQTLGDFLLESILAQGNTGVVFKAHDAKEDRPAAVKVLLPEVTANEENRDRFVRAMKTMLPIRHPNIVELYAAGKTGSYCWAAMEYVEGESVTKLIRSRFLGKEGTLDWREAYRLAVHIGRALEEAYNHKIIHRNVTPQNILLRHENQSYLLADLMLAKALEGTLARQVTAPGKLVGDVAYMSPERTQEGAEVDCRSDIYSLGASVYAMLTGHPPFEAKSLPELIRKIRGEKPKRPTELKVDVDEKLQDVVLRMIAKQPDDRFQSPISLLLALQDISTRHGLSADWADWR